MQNQRQTAGETAQSTAPKGTPMKGGTKPVWGIVAVIGVMVAVSMGDSLVMAAIATAVFGVAAYLGGYMEPLTKEGGAL